MMSSFSSLGTRSWRVASTTPAGTISQMARGLREFFHKIIERSGAGRAFAGELLHGFRAAIVDDAGVAIANQAAHHVGHPSAPDRSFRVAFCLLLSCELFEGKLLLQSK